MKKLLVDGQKECPKCKQYKDLEDFGNHQGASYNRSCYCRICANANGRKHHARRMKEDPTYRETSRRRYIRSHHGISHEEYQKRLAFQDYKCDICETKLEPKGHRTHLDHDHKTGKLRSMLCTNCNRGLGHFQDNERLLLHAAEYLKYWEKKNND